MRFIDAWAEVRGGAPGYTWSNANPHARQAGRRNRRIDYVLVCASGDEPGRIVLSAELEGTEALEGIQPSDHYALVVELAD